MSFAELADARGISRESAIRLIRKKRWRRQKDNQGRVIALIPEGWADPVERPEDDPAWCRACHGARWWTERHEPRGWR